MRDGYDGSRMQDIADVAGINKALLHYYFRSKDKLFEKVFDAKIQGFFPQVGEVFNQDIPFIDKIYFFIGLNFNGFFVIISNNYHWR